MVFRHAATALLLVACGTPSDARDEDAGGGATVNAERDGGAMPAHDISIAGTLVERLVNAPSNAVNETSWRGVANGGYVRFAVYRDGWGSVSSLGSPATEFTWLPSGDHALTFSGNPWFGDLTIVDFRDPRTLLATSRSGGVFGQRWDLDDTPPGK
jgi:hypothetical protein